MATKGTPNEGLDYIAGKVYVSGALTLLLYTNTANSLGPSTVLADLTQPTVANGYTPLTLSGTWAESNGVVTYTQAAGANTATDGSPMWVATGAWSSTVTGAAIVDLTAGKILHFKDNAIPFVAAAAKQFAINISALTGP